MEWRRHAEVTVTIEIKEKDQKLLCKSTYIIVYKCVRPSTPDIVYVQNNYQSHSVLTETSTKIYDTI